MYSFEVKLGTGAYHLTDIIEWLVFLVFEHKKTPVIVITGVF
jgi:hypothetical protein